MPLKNLAQLEEKSYDPRWFIWTVVFLIVSGVSLASYILITTSNDTNDTTTVFTLIHANHKKTK